MHALETWHSENNSKIADIQSWLLWNDFPTSSYLVNVLPTNLLVVQPLTKAGVEKKKEKNWSLLKVW